MNQIALIYQAQQDTQQRNDTQQADARQGAPGTSTGQTSNQPGKNSGTNIASSTQNADLQPEQYRAYFAVDEDKNVVIRIADAAGKVIKQFPPEDFLKASQILDDAFKKIFDVKA